MNKKQAKKKKPTKKKNVTGSDAFRNMFNRIADHYLDMAARMLAIQFQKGVMRLLGNIFMPFDFIFWQASFILICFFSVPVVLTCFW